MFFHLPNYTFSGVHLNKILLSFLLQDPLPSKLSKAMKSDTRGKLTNALLKQTFGTSKSFIIFIPAYLFFCFCFFFLCKHFTVRLIIISSSLFFYREKSFKGGEEKGM